MRVQAIHPAEVWRWWGFARPLIGEVFSICKEPRFPEDVYTALVMEKALLHVLFVDEVPRGVGVTEICGDRDQRYLNVWVLHFVGNVDANRIEILGWLDGLVKGYGLSRMRFQSPRAWSSLLRGAFKEKSVIYEREVK